MSVFPPSYLFATAAAAVGSEIAPLAVCRLYLRPLDSISLFNPPSFLSRCCVFTFFGRCCSFRVRQCFCDLYIYIFSFFFSPSEISRGSVSGLTLYADKPALSHFNRLLQLLMIALVFFIILSFWPFFLEFTNENRKISYAEEYAYS